MKNVKKRNYYLSFQISAVPVRSLYMGVGYMGVGEKSGARPKNCKANCSAADKKLQCSKQKTATQQTNIKQNYNKPPNWSATSKQLQSNKSKTAKQQTEISRKKQKRCIAVFAGFQKPPCAETPMPKDLIPGKY